MLAVFPCEALSCEPSAVEPVAVFCTGHHRNDAEAAIPLLVALRHSGSWRTPESWAAADTCFRSLSASDANSFRGSSLVRRIAMTTCSKAWSARSMLSALAFSVALGSALDMPAQAGDRCARTSARDGSSVEIWAYSGARRRNYVRSQSDCGCQVIVRSFRSRRTYECPCASKR